MVSGVKEAKQPSDKKHFFGPSVATCRVVGLNPLWPIKHLYKNRKLWDVWTRERKGL